MPAVSSSQRRDQKLQEISFLLTASSGYGHDPFGEPAAIHAVCAETTFAPQDAFS